MVGRPMMPFSLRRRLFSRNWRSTRWAVFKKVSALCVTCLHSIQVDHIAGGATQNSIRVAQWLLGGQVIQWYHIILIWVQLVILTGQPWALFIHGLCRKGRQQRDSFGKGSVWHFPWTSTREKCFALQCFSLSGKRMWCQGVLPAIWQTNRYISLNRNDLPSEENFGCGIL